MGLAQLENLPALLEKKRNLFSIYSQAFSSFIEFKIQKEPKYSKSNYWLQTLVLERGFEEQRNLILEATNASGIMTRPSWTLLHKLKPFENSPCMDLSTAESLEKRIINIPSSSNLG